MDFLELTREARSCRRFVESKPLSVEDVLWLMECGRLAPSARNAQELRFITITHGAASDELCGLARWAAALKDWGGPVPGERPTAFIAVLMPKGHGDLLWVDTGIFCQTIQLAAASRQWGACIIYSFERKGVVELLKIPSDYEPAILLALGVPAEKRVVEPMPANGSFTYWREADGSHHVPKRALSELILNRF